MFGLSGLGGSLGSDFGGGWRKVDGEDLGWEGALDTYIS